MPRAVTQRPVRFDQRLVLNRWFLSLLDVVTFDDLAKDLKDVRLEGYDENNVSRFYHVLVTRLFAHSGISNEQLLRYDENIFAHTQRISEKRDERIAWKYFQYLTLLATEVYLDRWFANKGVLCAELNTFREAFNDQLPLADRIEEFTVPGLSKLAFWSATGSGKTLLMHVHLLQYMHYAKKHGAEKHINKIILITPNEGLSAQHLSELEASSIPAQIFNKGTGTGIIPFHGGSYGNEKSVEIIEYTKLREESKEKTVALEAFEHNNLVFIDEGHKGAGGDVIKKYRDTLSEDGFAFEYSATFGQSIKAASTGKRKALEQEYAKAILFDYSYRFFYRDGYGKDYKILNLDDDTDEHIRTLYLTAGLLSFYQQVKLYGSARTSWQEYLLASPLWIFVGGKVTAVRTVNGKEVSDVVDILLFLRNFLRNTTQATANIASLLSGNTGLVVNGKDVFANTFSYLATIPGKPTDVYADILTHVFLANGGGELHIENLKGVEGEIGLRVGNSEYFGLINVGDDTKLLKLCEDTGFVVSEREFGKSLFRDINTADSKVNLLIGSKKFTEGWSSWRVSLMGLMNVGKSEGSEIIQLFGRGVRLKGKGMSLKRTKMLEGVRPPRHIEILETLNIFGVRADYMKAFKEYLEEEGLPSNETVQIVLPVIKTFDPSKRLKILRIKEGISFKRDGGKVVFGLEKDVRMPVVELDCYPKLQAIMGGVSAGTTQNPHLGILTPAHTAFFDYEQIFFELQKYKYEKSWYNVALSIEGIKAVLEQTSWYKLYIPKQQLDMGDYTRVRYWQGIATSLLKKYMVALYNFRKAEWEEPYLEYHEMDENDTNLIEEYQTFVGDSEKTLIEKLTSLKTLLEDVKKNSRQITSKDVGVFAYGGFTPFTFDRHLYQPLIHIEAGVGLQLTVKPVHLNEGEYKFVTDLQTFYETHKDGFANKELFLLRNKSKEGIGFFEAGNFYPDFIMWVLDGDTQHVFFVDPKGIRNLDLENDLKLNFHEKIKAKELQLGDTRVHLHSYVISVTPFDQLLNYQGDIKSLERKNVLFQTMDGIYIQKLFNNIFAEC